MNDDTARERRHESVDHVNPTDAGMMEPDPAHLPATGVMGDETLVRMTEGGVPPYPGLEEDEIHRSTDARPGPTDWSKTEIEKSG